MLSIGAEIASPLFFLNIFIVGHYLFCLMIKGFALAGKPVFRTYAYVKQIKRLRKPPVLTEYLLKEQKWERIFSDQMRSPETQFCFRESVHSEFMN
jgi:hypothetical protein